MPDRYGPEQMELNIQADCGNSPKKEFIKDLNISFAKNDVDFLLGSVTEDIHWTMVGDRVIQGRDQFAVELRKIAKSSARALRIDRVITHGKEGAACGVITMEDGTAYHFGDFYVFKNTKGTKIRSITSYVIEAKETEERS